MDRPLLLRSREELRDEKEEGPHQEQEHRFLDRPRERRVAEREGREAEDDGCCRDGPEHVRVSLPVPRQLPRGWVHGLAKSAPPMFERRHVRDGGYARSEP